MRAPKLLLRLSFLLPLLWINTLHAGSALSLDGVGQYVEVPDNSALDIRGSITLELWAYPHVVRQNGMRLIDKVTVGYGDGYMLDTYPSNRVRFGVTPGGITTTEALPVNQWTHVAAVYDSAEGEIAIYFNGEEKAQISGVSGAISANGHPLRLGVNSNVDGDWFYGEMDDVRIWNKARTQNEIMESMGGLVSGSEPGLVAYWKFDETTGDTLYDSAGTNHGQLIGGTRTRPPLSFVNMGDSIPNAVWRTYWGDFDNDGDLDILTNSQVFSNSGGTFTASGHSVPVDSVYFALGDADNDNDLDLHAVASRRPYAMPRVYVNGPAGFGEMSLEQSDTGYGGSVWGDIDNDGDQDLITSMSCYWDNGGRNPGRTRVDLNSRTGFSLAQRLDYFSHRLLFTPDFDNDGDLDVMLTGGVTSSDSRLLRTDDGTLSYLQAPFRALFYRGDADWGDYDNDGDLDVVMAGAEIDGSAFEAPATVYRNDNGTFVDAQIDLPVTFYSGVEWGDMDNDGDLDIVLLNRPENGADQTHLLLNTNGSFAAATESLPTGYAPVVACADADNDNDLDLLLIGQDGSASYAAVFENSGPSGNTPPQKPTGLDAVITDTSIVLTWDRATDRETPGLGLSYNIFIASSRVERFFKSPLADTSTGRRLLPEIGNVGQVTTWTFRRGPDDSLPHVIGPDHWGVQAIDHSHIGSPFAVSDLDNQITYLTTINDSVVAPEDFLSWMVVHGEKIAGYHVQVDDDSLFGSCEVDDSMSLTLSGNGYYFTQRLSDIPGSDTLVSGTKYYWRVKPYYKSNVPTVFTHPPRQFWYGHVTGDPVGFSRRIPGAYGLTLHSAKESHGPVQIHYQLPHQTHVTIGVYTPMGRLVSVVVSGHQPAGYHVVGWRHQGMGNGLYLVRMRTHRGFEKTRDLVIPW